MNHLLQLFDRIIFYRYRFYVLVVYKRKERKSLSKLHKVVTIN